MTIPRDDRPLGAETRLLGCSPSTHWKIRTGDGIWQSVRRFLILTVIAVAALGGSTLWAQSPANSSLDHATAQCGGHCKWVFATGVTINKSSPAIGADGTIYVGNGGQYLSATPDWSLFAINPDGTLQWQYRIGSYVYSPVLGADGTIYVQDATSTVHALAPDGTLRWKYPFATELNNSSTMGTLAPAIDEDGTLYVAADTLYAINPDGTLKWRYSPTIVVDRIRTAPALSRDGIVYVGVIINMSPERPEGRIGGVLWAIDRGGRLKWQTSLGPGFAASSPSIGADGTIYLGSDAPPPTASDSFVHALKPDGTVRWSYRITERYTVRSSPSIGPEGTIYVGTRIQLGMYVDLLALNPDGTLKWNYRVNLPDPEMADIYGAPAIGSDGIIYFGVEDGNVYAVNPDGTLAWQYATHNGITVCSPALGDDGTLYIGNNSGNLFALNTTSKGLADSAWPKFHQNNRNTGSMQAVPAAPTGLTYTAGASTAALFWNAAASGAVVSSYVIEAGSRPGMSDLASIDTGDRENTFAFQTHGVYPQVFYIRVRSKGAGGVGPPSHEVTVNLGVDTQRVR